MSTNRRKMMTTSTVDTEGLEDLAVERSPGAHGGRLVLLRHRRRMASVPLQMSGPSGVANAAPLDSVPPKQYQTSPDRKSVV